MKFATILAAAAVLAMASYMVAQEPTSKPTSEPAKKWDHLWAKIVKVDGTNVIVMAKATRDEDPKEITVKTDDKTVIEINKEEAKLADLKPDMRAIITPKEGTATKIAAWTKPTTKPAASPDK
jgi:hypothetical protein